MRLIWITLIALILTMTLVLTSCALLPQALSESKTVEGTNASRPVQADQLTPITTEFSYATHRDSPLQLPPGLTVEEYALIDQPMIEPLTFHPVLGTQEDILAMHHDERLKTYPDNSFFDGEDYAMLAYLGLDELVARQQYSETGSEGWVAVTRNGQEIYRIDTGPAGPLPIAALRGLWAYNGHWVLETARIVLCQECNMIIKEAISQISQEGKLLNDEYGYEEMFDFQLMAGAPFYFFKQDDKISFSSDGQVVMAGYDEIPHYECCSSSSLNPVSAENMVSFFAKRGNLWYYVEIGVYGDDKYPGTPTPEVQPCSQVPDINQPDEVVRAFLEEVSESDLQEASRFWIQGVWDGGSDQLVASWATSNVEFTIGKITYAGFFAPDDYRLLGADDPRVSGALVEVIIDGEPVSFDVEKTCNSWLIYGWIVSDKIKE